MADGIVDMDALAVSGSSVVDATSPNPDLVCLIDACRSGLIPVGYTTARQLAAAGKIPTIRLGRKIFVVRDRYEAQINGAA